MNRGQRAGLGLIVCGVCMIAGLALLWWLGIEPVASVIGTEVQRWMRWLENLGASS